MRFYKLAYFFDWGVSVAAVFPDAESLHRLWILGDWLLTRMRGGSRDGGGNDVAVVVASEGSGSTCN